MAEYTPMMQQYLATKEEYKDCILFYRLGDFYEMFFDDAQIVSRELELTLTGKACGQEEKAPMCGVPFHAADSYLNKLVSKGYKVAICEQVEDPKEAKGIVKREVIRIVTPGTNIDSFNMVEGKNNFIISIIYKNNLFGIAACDVSTGEFFTSEVNDLTALYDELFRFDPSEILYHKSVIDSGFDFEYIDKRLNCLLQLVDVSMFDEVLAVKLLLEHFHSSSVEAIGLLDFEVSRCSCGALLRYLYDTQKSNLNHITKIITYKDKNYMLLDSSSRRNLELTETMRDKQKKGSLLGVLDKTKTAMGARTLRSFVEQPLVNVDEIALRQDAIAEINSLIFSREELREYLNPIYDLERLLTKISYKSANPRDLIAFKQSISMLPHIKALLKDFNTRLLCNINDDIDSLDNLYKLIDEAIIEEPPISSREGDIIKSGYSEEIDSLRSIKRDGKSWLLSIETKEKEATGIKNLRIKYNKVFGYYLEVTNSYIDLVPDYFIRKQTLTNAERYYTAELKELEDKILNSQDRLNALEFNIFSEIRDEIAANTFVIQKTAKAIAILDAMISLAVCADNYHYVRPVINNRGIIDIKNGRHPVVEQMIEAQQYIANDTFLDNNENVISIITGPNMAGKSTYMRQVALIVLMAQIGSFVPADEATIGIVDRIFTRVGASDDLATGQSTFMVEMNEVSNILRNATRRSLLILDEIGRGTSTYDGLSIAWAVVEHISDKDILGAKTLFATHYHELTELEGQLDGVKNYCIAVHEENDDIVFLRKIVRGGADQSYGIQVAKLAGLPESVVTRSKEIVKSLNMNDVAASEKVKKYKDAMINETQSNDNPLINKLKDIDISKITPLEAMNLLNNLHEEALNENH